MAAEECVAADALDGVGAGKPLDLAVVADPELRGVEVAHLREFKGDLLVRRDSVEMPALDHEGPRADQGGTFNYAEMAALIAPRPFQVERGHSDGVAPDEWIGYEFAKVKRTYDTLGLADRVDITYFNGGHMIKAEGTFEFLAKHLDWPRGHPE